MERDWMQHAACRGMNPDIFYPERGDMHSYRLATQTCQTCTVQHDCATYGLQLDEQHLTPGIFGGMSQRERRKLRAANRRSSALPMGRATTPA